MPRFPQLRYAIRAVSELIPDEDAAARVRDLLWEDRRAAANRYRPFAAQRQSLAASWALHQLLIQEGIDPADLMLARTAAGQPYCVNRSNVFISFSHTEAWVMAAFASVPVGCDIERIRSVSDEMASLVLSSDEKSRYAKQSSPTAQAAYFTRCWVRKESFVKARGTGFEGDPSQIDLAQLTPDYQFEDCPTPSPNHLASLCLGFVVPH